MSTQSTQYNDIGGHYDSIKQLPGNLLDTATLLTYIGDIEGLEVLDLGCGSGFYSRKAIQRGARRVVGLDISSSMIEAACRESEGDSRMEFYVADCSKPLNVGQFDIIFAFWFLDYAANAGEQVEMWRNIFANLKPGGRCIGITTNFDMLERPFPKGSQFGLEWKVLKHVPGGVKFKVSVAVSPPFDIEAYMLSKEVYEASAREAGFSLLEWLDPIDPKNPRIDFEPMARNMPSRYFQAWRAVE
ncbi:hypothetical protein CNMCM5623_002599 [Aspergillus felis]|uniref:Methyltransferase domain-containing protein n=1 Tax=Aspergillus felis TaxID=1287682 RepID=A0A8H6PPE8_9EURO|nr:hypothetical protein CNMCM5623_002599 [Aspergillus felis]